VSPFRTWRNISGEQGDRQAKEDENDELKMGSFVTSLCKYGKTHEEPMGPNARGVFEPGCTRGVYHARLFPDS
jgi:hypothetical protein